MIPVKTALGALSILGAFLGNMGPAVEPGDKQTKKFCKDVVASCQENPAEVCEEIWRFCEEAPVGSAKKKTVTVEVTKTFNWSEGELEQQQDELEAMQDEVEALAEELQECYAEGCSPSEIKRLKSQLDQEVAALKKQAKALKSQIRPEPPELPEVPEPPAPPVAPKKSTWVTPFAPMAPLAPMAPNWGGTVIVIPGGEVRFEAPEADSFRFEFGEEGFDGECAECQREKLREEVRQKYQDKIEAQIDEILERQDEALQKKLKKKAKKERKESKDHPDE